MKWKASVFILALMPMFLFFMAAPTSAAKKRTWKTTSTTTSSSSNRFSISAKLTQWKQYLNLNFKGMASTTGVNYELIYNGNNTEQGVYGNVKASEGSNVLRSLFLGTCSRGACVSHKDISNMHLTITYQTTTGQSVTKKYKVRY